MEWFSDEESVVKPEALAPKDMGFLRLGVVVFVKRVYDWMRAAVLGDVVLEREGGVVGAKRFFVVRDGFAVFHSYFGAPAAVSLAEVLIAAGLKNILVFGEAGSISPEVGVGDVVVPVFAVREEGTSYHYLPPGIEVGPSETFLRRVEEFLRGEGIPFKEGGVWTTDAPFRETMGKVLKYSRAGVLAVEMECSALFALSIYRRVSAAVILTITDTLWEGVWKPAFNEPRVIEVEKRVSETLVRGWGELVG